MTIRVGIIGTGGIGTDHADKLAHSISGSVVVAVTDIDRARAEKVAADVGGAHVFDDGFELIRSVEVDAVLIASIGETHAAFTLASIEAGKPVMCEKPLAPTTPECLQVLEAEVAFGRRLVIVGFMRRYDTGYRQVKASLDSGSIGEALMLHNIHRNASAPESFTSFMSMTEFDHPRDRHQSVAARRGAGVRPGDPNPAHPQGARSSPGPAIRGLHDGVRHPVDRGVLRQLPVWL